MELDKRLTFREAVPEDSKALHELICEAMEYYRMSSGIVADVLESLTEDEESVRDRILKHHCLCVYHDEAPVGTITVSYCDNPMKHSFSSKTSRVLSQYQDCAYISRFAVSRDYRDTGLGVMLMNEALKLPISKSGLTLLHTAISNTKMRDFYINRGFRVLDSEASRGYERGLFAYLSNQDCRNNRTA